MLHKICTKTVFVLLKKFYSVPSPPGSQMKDRCGAPSLSVLHVLGDFPEAQMRPSPEASVATFLVYSSLW